MTDFTDPESIAATPEGAAFVEAAGALCALLVKSSSSYGTLFLPTTAMAAAAAAARMIAEDFERAAQEGGPDVIGAARILSGFANDVDKIMGKAALALIDEIDARRLVDLETAKAEADKLKRREGGEQ